MYLDLLVHIHVYTCTCNLLLDTGCSRFRHLTVLAISVVTVTVPPMGGGEFCSRPLVWGGPQISSQSGSSFTYHMGSFCFNVDFKSACFLLHFMLPIEHADFVSGLAGSLAAQRLNFISCPQFKMSAPLPSPLSPPPHRHIYTHNRAPLFVFALYCQVVENLCTSLYHIQSLYSPLGPIHVDMSGGAATISAGFPLHGTILLSVVVCWYIE